MFLVANLFSTWFLASVFSNYVVFDGDSFLHTYDSSAAQRTPTSAGTQLAMAILNKQH